MVLESNIPLSPSRSLAGTWGEEIRRKKFNTTKDPDAAERFSSVSKSSWTSAPFQQSKLVDPSKYSKFQQLQKNGAVIVNKAAYDRDQAADAEQGVLLDSFDFATGETGGGRVNSSSSRLGSRPISTGTSGSRTAKGGKHGDLASDERISTVTRDSYRPYTSSSPFDSQSSIDMKRTSYRMLRSNDAPIATGRSGTRVERGVSTSGLLGERLMLTEEPKWNTLAQKSWLYHNDPALYYKINGVPVAPPVTDRSIILPSEVLSDIPRSSWKNQRSAVLTDDFDPPHSANFENK